MAPLPSTAPLSGSPLCISSVQSPETSLHISHEKAANETRTNLFDTAVSLMSNLPGECFKQRGSISSAAPTSPAAVYPLPATAHSDLDMMSASCSISVSPFITLPPLTWAVDPLSVAGPARHPPHSTQLAVTTSAGQTAVPVCISPASVVAARHHPPLVRHLLDKSMPPPSGVRLPPFIVNAAIAAENPVVPGAEKRRLSAPATARWPRSSVCHSADGASVDPSTDRRSSAGAADTAPAESFISHDIAPDPSCTKSDLARSSQHMELQSGKSKIKPLSARPGDLPNARALPIQSAVCSFSKVQRTPMGPVLQRLLRQAGTPCPHEKEIGSNQAGQNWPHPKILIPPFFSSPAALQRSENTLQAELASSVLRCRAAELKQQRLLRMAAALVHQAVRLHASRIADLIEIHGTTAAATGEALAARVSPMACKLSIKPERTSGAHAKRGFRTYGADPTDRGNSEKLESSYYDLLGVPAEPGSYSSVGGSMHCLPVIVAPAGTDAADHRLAVHSFLRECMRRSRRDSVSVNSATGLAYLSHRGNLFLRFAVIRPADCSSVYSAMHAICEQLTQIPSLSLSPSPSGGRSQTNSLQHEAFKENTSNRKHLHSFDNNGALKCEASGATCNVETTCSAGSHVYIGNKRSFTCCDGGASAAWGESAGLLKSGPVPFSRAAGDACMFASIGARHEDEAAAILELQQLIRRDLCGAEAGAEGVSIMRLQEEFWEIEKKAAVASERTRWSKGQNPCEQSRASFSCHRCYCKPDEKVCYHRQDIGAHQRRSMQRQQRHERQQNFDGCAFSCFARKKYVNACGSSRAYVRKVKESDNLCEKLASWWAAQQEYLLQQSRGGCSGDVTGPAATATFRSRRRECQAREGETCVSWSVRTRGAATRLRDSVAAHGSELREFLEERSEAEEQGQSGDESSQEEEEEGEEKEERQRAQAVEAYTTDRESTDEDESHSQAKVPSETNGGFTTATGRATRSPPLHGCSKANTIQPAAIVIILEEAEAFPGGLLVKLLQLLALLRRQLGIPLIVVATASTSVTVLQELCDTLLSSSCSLTIEPATLLQPARVQQQLLQLLLCCPAALPFALPLAAAERLLQSVEETSSSVLQLLRRLQLLLRIFYQHHPLAFLCRGLDGVAELMLLEEDQVILGSTEKISSEKLPQSGSSSNNKAAHSGGATSNGKERLSDIAEGEDIAAEQENANEEERCNSSTIREQSCTFESNRGSPEPVSASSSAQASTATAASRGLTSPARHLHALRVVKQLRRRVELLSFSSLTEDHVHLLRQLLRHTNEVFIHLTAAQHEGLLFFDRCCWQQVQLQRQHERRIYLAAVAAASNGAVPAGSSSLLPPLQRDAAASTLALRCRPEEDDEYQKQQLTPSKETTGGGSPLMGVSGNGTFSTQNHTQRKVCPGCRRLGGCVARRSAVALLQRWWGSRGLLLLQKVEEEEKQRKEREQQQEQQLPKISPCSGMAAGGSSEKRRTTEARDTQQTLMSLRLNLLCKEVLPVASVELLQRRVGSCMGYRLLFVLQQQLQRCRRLASGATADMQAAARSGNCGIWSAPQGMMTHTDSSSGNQENEEMTAAEEEHVLMTIAAEEDAHSNCRQTIETLDLLIGAHEESSCLLRKCKPRARVQEIEQDVRRVVTSLYQQFAVAAPARLSAAAASTHSHDVLVDPAALMLPLKLFRAQVKREARLLRLLAAAEEAQSQREHHPLSDVNLAASGAVRAAAAGKNCEPPQWPLPFSLETSAHSSEVVRVLDALDALICDLEKAASGAAAAAPSTCADAVAVGAGKSCRVERRVSSAPYTASLSLSRSAAETRQEDKICAQDDIYSAKEEMMESGVVAKRRRLARCSSDAIVLRSSAAAMQQNKRLTKAGIETLRVLLSLKRRFLRWVEEALLLLLLPLSGWHPLGGELAVWGGALGFEVAAAVHAPPGAAAAGCSSLSHNSAAGVSAHRRRTAGALGGRLAAAADLVCSSFEAAPQTETLQHAAMGSTSFLERFNVPFHEEEDEEEAVSLFQTQQERHQPQHHLERPSQATQENAAEMGSRLRSQVEKGRVEDAWTPKAKRHEEEIKLEDVAILLRLVDGAGRRINTWDLFCAFCRDLLRDRSKQRKIEIDKELHTECSKTKIEEHQSTRLEDTGSSCSPRLGSSSFSPPPKSRKSSIPTKLSNPQRNRKCMRTSESDLEEQVLRLMERESFDPHVDSLAICDKHKSSHGCNGIVTRASSSSNSHDAAHDMSTECTQQQKVVSSRVLHAHCTSEISPNSADKPRARISRVAGASAFSRRSTSPAAVASIAGDLLHNEANTSPVSGTMDECVPPSLLQQLQLRFAVAVETLDQQLGVIRLPSAASTAAAVERVMRAEDGVEDVAVNPDFTIFPQAAEQINGSKVSSREKSNENESDEEDISDDEDGKHEEIFSAADIEESETKEGGKQKNLGNCEVEARQPHDNNPTKTERQDYPAMRTRRSCCGDVAACGTESGAASSSERQYEDAHEEGLKINVRNDTLTQEVRNMRKLLRNVFARRIHFVSVQVEPTAESCKEKEHDNDKIRGREDDIHRSTCEEATNSSLRTKSCSRRKSRRRSKKKVPL